MSQRLAGGPVGVTAAPFMRSGPAAALDLALRAERAGYGSFWVAEVTGTEAFSVLGAVSQRVPGLALGTGVLPVQVRSPGVLAMAAASLQALTADRDVPPLAHLAPVLDAEQLASALEIATAARDDGYEGSWLGILVRYLDVDTATAARIWVADRAAEHFAEGDIPGRKQRQEQFADLVASLLNGEPPISGMELRHLRELSAGLDPVPRARCLGLIASAQPEPPRQQLWAEVEDLLASADGDDYQRATLLSHLACAATGARQQHYLTEALRLERGLTDEYRKIGILRLLPETPEVDRRVVALRRETQDTETCDSFYANLAWRLPLADFDDTDLYEYELPFSDDLGSGRVSLIRRLVKAGQVAAALQFVDEAWQDKRECIEAVAAVLPADRVNDMLARDPHNARVIARMVELGQIEAALARILDIPAGADRFIAVARCVGVRTPAPAPLSALLETVVGDLKLVPYVESLWTCLEAGAPQLAKLPEPARSDALLSILGLLGSTMRLEAMPGLYLLAPVIDATSGKQGVKDAFRAVAQAAAWWPAYPQNNFDQP
jgi:hypothetical protein